MLFDQVAGLNCDINLKQVSIKAKNLTMAVLIASLDIQRASKR